MDYSVLFDQVSTGQVNIDDIPWSVDNLLFEDVLTSDSNEDIKNIFKGVDKDESFDDDTISYPGTPRSIPEIGDEEIKNLPVQELNKLLRTLPQDEAAKIRQRRRNLKNRGYALTCRQRRLQLQEDLINENNFLRRQLEDNRERLGKVMKERNAYKHKLHQLQASCKGEFMMERLVLPVFSLESEQVV